MIMLGFMETEKEFIKNWEKYRGAAGCLRYLACWFLLGIIVIPLMLTVINPDIWSTVRMDQLAEEAVVFFGFGFWFCILPSLLIGLGMWDEKIVLLVVGVCILLFNPDQSTANLEIARNAKNAQEAAAAISGNNQRELMIHMAGNFLAGIGIALTAGGFFLNRKKQ